MWGGWAPFSLFSLTLSQPQYRRFSSSVFTHRQTPTTCSDKMAHVCTYIHISAAPNVEGLVVFLRGDESWRSTVLLSTDPGLWIGLWLACAKRVKEKPLFFATMIETLRCKTSVYISTGIFHCLLQFNFSCFRSGEKGWLCWTTLHLAVYESFFWFLLLPTEHYHSQWLTQSKKRGNGTWCTRYELLFDLQLFCIWISPKAFPQCNAHWSWCPIYHQCFLSIQSYCNYVMIQEINCAICYYINKAVRRVVTREHFQSWKK